MCTSTVTACTLPDVKLSIHAVDSRKCISTIIQTAWSSTAAACWLSLVHVPSTSVYVNKISVAAVVFSSAHSCNVSSPPPQAALYDFTAYLEVGSLCYSLVLCDTGSISLCIIPCVKAEPCVHLWHLNATCFVRQLHGILPQK